MCDENRIHQRMLIRIGGILIIVSSFFVFSACGSEGESNSEIKIPSPNIKSVKAIPVKAQSSQGSVEHVGTLSANLKVNVATEMGGAIESLFFERGDSVKKGQVLAEISTSSIRIEVLQAKAVHGVAKSHLKKVEKGNRPEEIRIAKAAVEQAEAALSEAANNFKRVKDLYGLKAISNSEYDSAKRGVEIARANLESAQQQLQLSKEGPRVEDREAARAELERAQASLALSKDRLKKSVLLSPCDGIVAFRRVEEGEVVGPGTVITQVVDTSRMKIRLSLGEKYIPVLEREKRFTFTVDAIPGEEFICRLAFISPSADPVTRSFPLELTVEKSVSKMADGMTVRVRFPLMNQKKSVKVPSAWLSEENGRMGLFVVEKGKASFKRVTLGSYYAHKVEILSGLSDHELVITNPAGLKSGESVRY
jgi:multidrug efflux pump subunit AcrA (membrane-fusion protein)